MLKKSPEDWLASLSDEARADVIKTQVIEQEKTKREEFDSNVQVRKICFYGAVILCVAIGSCAIDNINTTRTNARIKIAEIEHSVKPIVPVASASVKPQEK